MFVPTNTTTAPTNVQILVAIDMDDTGRIHDLLDALRTYAGHDVVLSVETVDYTTRRSGDVVPEYRIQFDAGRLRNTEAAGIAFRMGYVSNVRPLPGPAQHQPCGCVYVPQG